MCNYTNLILSLLLFSFIGFVLTDVKSKCLQCICKMNNCMSAVGKCKSETVKSKTTVFCGPYKLSESYWTAAGKPEQDFGTCTTRLQCSEKAVRSYMELYANPCRNKLTPLSCEQFIRVHYGGSAACKVGSPEYKATNDIWNKAKQSCVFA